MNDKSLLVIPFSTDLDLQAFLHFPVPVHRAVLLVFASLWFMGWNQKMIMQEGHGQCL